MPRNPTKPLKTILNELTARKYKKDHPLEGGLHLTWIPPNELIVSRKGIVPSPNEVRIVENYLTQLGFTFTTSNLRNKTSRLGAKWFYYRLIVVKQTHLFQEPKP